MKAYVTVNSAARNQPQSNNVTVGPGLYTTGNTDYYQIYPFAPYQLNTDPNTGQPVETNGEYTVSIDANSNHIQFLMQDRTVTNAPVQVLNSSQNSTFDVYLPNIGQSLTLDQLQESLENNLNLVARTGTPLEHLPNINHIFTVIVTYNSVVNPDMASVAVEFTPNASGESPAYYFQMTFFTYGNLAGATVAPSIPASDAEYVVQDPYNGTDPTYTTTIPNLYPNPNCYAIDLNKTYKFIKAIRVVKSQFPNTDTIINSTNNHVTFQLIDKNLPLPTASDPYSQNIKTSSGSINWEVYLPYGNYTLPELVTQLTLSVNNMLFGEAKLANIFTFTGNLITNVFVKLVSMIHMHFNRIGIPIRVLVGAIYM